MPESASRGGVSVPGGSARGVSALGGVCSRGVSAPGGCGIPACTAADSPPPLWTESQTPVKTLPWPNFVAAGNNNWLNIGDGLDFVTSERSLSEESLSDNHIIFGSKIRLNSNSRFKV